MKCPECQSLKNSYDERMGETICDDCGLVLVSGMFEETVHVLDKVGDNIHSADKGHLGSVITGKGSYKFNRLNKSKAKKSRVGLKNTIKPLWMLKLKWRRRFEKITDSSISAKAKCFGILTSPLRVCGLGFKSHPI